MRTSSAMPGGSYRPGEGVDLDDELARLEAQAELSWPEEFRVLTELGVRDGDAVLDAGCGSAAFTVRLRAALPAGRLTALDADERLLGRARARLARLATLTGLAATRIVAGDLADPPVADASQDVVISRFVFQHLAAPLAVATRLRRLLRPGGLLAVIEVDAGLWGAAVPDLRSGYAEAYQAMAADQAGRRGDRFIARRLPGLLEAAGYHDVLVRPYAYGGVPTDGPLAAQLSPERFRPLVERGALSVGAYARAHAAWERFRKDGGHVLLLGFVVCGRA
jgi:ubiquinone/menaquinone biosynthesis C-methylase UbiE